MNHSAKIASTLLLLALASMAKAQSEPLGRLFFTPEQRLVLERQKHSAGAPADSTPTILNGMVRSSSGRNTVWVNGVPQNGLATSPGWRVGEAIAPGDSESQRLFGTGSISVRRTPVAKDTNHGRH
jgi:hypothetical protein